MTEQHASSRFGTRLRRVATGLLLLMIALAAALAIRFEPWLRERVSAEAARAGFRVEFEDYRLGWSKLVLTGLRFARDRPIPATGSARSVVVTRAGFRVTDLAFEGVQVTLTGSPLTALTERGSGFGFAATGVPAIRATELELEWKRNSLSSPWFRVQNGTLETDGKYLDLGGRPVLSDRAIGFMSLALTEPERTAVLQLWFPESAERQPPGAGRSLAPLTLEVTSADEGHRAKLALKETPLDRVLEGFGFARESTSPWPWPESATIAATADLRLPARLSTETPKGQLSISLNRFEPPHPPELRGFDFGDRTDIFAELTVPRSMTRASLRRIKLQAGPLELVGKGELELEGPDPTIHLDLDGALGCATIAEARAQATLDSIFATLASRAARKVVTGSVSVSLTVDASLRDPARPRIKKTLGVGCGLRPLTLADLPKLGDLPIDLSELEAEIRSLPWRLGPPRPSPDGSGGPGTRRPGSFPLPNPGGLPDLLDRLPNLPGFPSAPRGAGGEPNTEQ